MQSPRVMVLQPPSPPYKNVSRDWQGGFGVAAESKRSCYGHDSSLNAFPCSALLYSLGALEEAGAEVQFVDGQVEQLDQGSILSRIRDFEPHLLAAAISLPSLEGDLQLLDSIKRAFPAVGIAATGTVVKVLHREVLLRSKGVDMAVSGDPEVVLPHLSRELQAGRHGFEGVPGVATRWHPADSAEPQGSALGDFAHGPKIPWHLLPMSRYYSTALGRPRPSATLMSSRGCPYPCSYYCPYPIGFGARMLLRDPRLVGDELQCLCRDYGRELILFRDQVFTFSREHSAAVCEEILSRGLSFTWFCETRLDRVDSDLLKLMKRAGCFAVHYGLESGDPDLLASVAKPGVDLGMAAASVRATKEAGLRAHLHVILGLPDENETSLVHTAKAIRALKPHTVNITWATPFPGTRFWDDAEREGLFLDPVRDYACLSGKRMVVRTRCLGPEALRAARRHWVRAIDGPLPLWFARGAARRTVAGMRRLLHTAARRSA